MAKKYPVNMSFRLVVVIFTSILLSGDATQNGVRVVCPPHLDEIQAVSRNLGDALTLLCKNATGEVAWLKNEKSLPDDCKENKRTARCFTHKQRLTFRSITKADAGSYKCLADNKESPVFEVKVSPPKNTTTNSTPTVSSDSLTQSKGTTKPPKPVPHTTMGHFFQSSPSPISSEPSTQRTRSSITSGPLPVTSSKDLPTHATPKDSSSKVLLIVTVTVGSVTLTLFVVLVLIIWRVVKKRTGELSLTQPRTQPDGINAGMMTEIFDILLEQRDNGARPAASTSV
jgi:hypothetical protein